MWLVKRLSKSAYTVQPHWDAPGRTGTIQTILSRNLTFDLKYESWSDGDEKEEGK